MASHLFEGARARERCVEIEGPQARWHSYSVGLWRQTPRITLVGLTETAFLSRLESPLLKMDPPQWWRIALTKDWVDTICRNSLAAPSGSSYRPGGQGPRCHLPSRSPRAPGHGCWKPEKLPSKRPPKGNYFGIGVGKKLFSKVSFWRKDVWKCLLIIFFLLHSRSLPACLFK